MNFGSLFLFRYLSQKKTPKLIKMHDYKLYENLCFIGQMYLGQEQESKSRKSILSSELFRVLYTIVMQFRVQHANTEHVILVLVPELNQMWETHANI